VRARDGGVKGAELRGGEEAREDAPPSTPATAWVWNMARVSSTFMSREDFLCRIIIVNHRTLPAERELGLHPFPN
jgi:hypothetical protein